MEQAIAEEPKPSGRNIPGYILQSHRISSKDKFYLAVIHSHPWTPSNQKIAEIVGCNETKESVRQHIVKLEQLGVITNNHKKGKNRKLAINSSLVITARVIDGIVAKGLTIHPVILEEVKSCSQRLVAAVEIAFGDKSNGWKAWKIGMHKRSFLRNKSFLQKENKLQKLQESIEEKGKVLTPQKGKVLTLAKARFWHPRSKEFLGKESRLSDSLSKDNSYSPEASNLVNFMDSKKDVKPLDKKEDNMSAQVTIMAKFNKPEFGQKKNAELEMISVYCPHITKPCLNKPSYPKSARVIRGLKNGLLNEYGPEIMNNIANDLAGYGINKAQVLAVFQKQYNNAERMQIYKSLERLFDPGFTPSASNKMTLADAFYSRYKVVSSWLVRVIIDPPQRKIEYTYQEKEERKQVLEFMLRDWEKLEEDELSKVIDSCHYYFKRSLLPLAQTNKNIHTLCKDGFCNFMNSFVQWLVKEYPHMEPDDANITPGWFKPHSKPMKKFLKEGKKHFEWEKERGRPVPLVLS